MPVLVVNPRSDKAFTDLVHDLVANGAESPDVLQARLRVTYPRAVARRRVLAGEQVETWYVYREGTWLSASD